VIDPELVFIAEVDGKTAGFALGVPNFTEALRYANGLQYPWDFIRLLLAQKKIRSISFKILAIDPDYWGYGLEVLMFLEMGKALLRKGYDWIDASLTNEFNPQTNKLAPRLGAYVYRKYREYQLKL
jgi:GNAT superfamily N-acetyltransferase